MNMTYLRNGKKTRPCMKPFIIQQELVSLADSVGFCTVFVGKIIMGLLNSALKIREFKMAYGSFDLDAHKDWKSQSERSNFGSIEKKISNKWNRINLEVKAVIICLSLGYSPEISASIPLM